VCQATRPSGQCEYIDSTRSYNAETITFARYYPCSQSSACSEQSLASVTKYLALLSAISINKSLFCCGDD